MFGSLTSGCRFKQREQRALFRGGDAPDQQRATREGALGSLDFFGGDDEAAEEPAASAPATTTSRAARRRRARKAVPEDAEAADEPDLSASLPAATAISADMSEREMADANALRRALRIHAYGTELPAPVQSATEMADRYAMRPALRRNVLSAGYHELTRVQMQAVPCMMARRDLVACAPTGSGKTAAFAIPMLAQLSAPRRQGLRALVIAPTQELARQTYREMLKLSQDASLGICVLTKKLAATAAAAARGQALRRYDAMVCTPQRLVTLINKEVLSLHTVTEAAPPPPAPIASSELSPLPRSLRAPSSPAIRPRPPPSPPSPPPCAASAPRASPGDPAALKEPDAICSLSWRRRRRRRQVTLLVMDEADKLLELGFLEQVRRRRRQRCGRRLGRRCGRRLG